MSIRINDQVISGKYEPSSYRYVGEIFQSAIPIDDIRVTLLDGHKIYESEGYGSFIQYMHSIIMLYPQLACTEDEWQAINTTYGECGKFVISENNIRLPKIVSFVQGLSSLQDLATLVEAGLPNITGYLGDLYSWGTGVISTGAFAGSLQQTASLNVSGSAVKFGNANFNASKSNPIYGNSNTVQPQSIRYPYYIVLATGVTQEVKAKEELMTNIPFTLFESKYSEVELNNASWLLSSGQWNSRELYPTAYNELMRAYSEGSSRLSIKLHISEYDDYDFVLNLNDETFRLPLLNGSEDLPSNKYEDLTINVSGTVYTAPANGWYYLEMSATNANQYASLRSTNGYSEAKSAPTSDSTVVLLLPASKGDAVTVGYNLAGSKKILRFSYAQGNGSLYFYVGETVQNTSLINTGKLTQEVAELKSKVYLKESYTNGTSWYRVYSDGWCEQGGTGLHSKTATEITLLKPYKDVNYSVITNARDSNTSGYQVCILSRTTTAFSWYYYNSSGTFPADWRACGYIT